MALQDFIEKMAEQNDSDVIYSKQPAVVTKIVPPEKSTSRVSVDEHVKVITPNDGSITLKFTNLRVVRQKQEEVKQETKTQNKFNFKFNNKKPVETKKEVVKEVKEAKEEVKKIEKPETENEMIERLFAESLTNDRFKSLWIEKYKTAKAGKSLGKENVFAEKIKKGEFQIDELEGIPRVFVLPEYDFRSKDVGDILNDKWLKK